MDGHTGAHPIISLQTHNKTQSFNPILLQKFRERDIQGKIIFFLSRPELFSNRVSEIQMKQFIINL